jgi:hypothetical protein
VEEESLKMKLTTENTEFTESKRKYATSELPNLNFLDPLSVLSVSSVVNPSILNHQ